MRKRHLFIDLITFAGILALSACPLTPTEAEFSEVQTGETGIAAALPAEYISIGKSVLGTSGQAVCSWNPANGKDFEAGQFTLNSTAPRNISAPKISVFFESTAANLPAGYRAIPDATRDHDSVKHSGGANPQEMIQPVQRFTDSNAPWSTTTCGGPSFHSLSEMIADCKNRLGSHTTWDGTIKGRGTEGVWKLVARTGIKEEVWISLNTGLLVSSRVTSAPVNWCYASGANDNPRLTGDLEELRRPNDMICRLAAYQRNLSQDMPISLCFEHVEFATEGAGVASRQSGKAGLRTLGANINTSVQWRLPTYSDYARIHLDGFHYVLPDAGPNVTGFTPADTMEWTATTLARDTGSAHAYSATGLGSGATGWPRTSSDYVRCIGRIAPNQNNVLHPALHRLTIGAGEPEQFNAP
jgi:hypothetical protein